MGKNEGLRVVFACGLTTLSGKIFSSHTFRRCDGRQVIEFPFEFRRSDTPSEETGLNAAAMLPAPAFQSRVGEDPKHAPPPYRYRRFQRLLSLPQPCLPRK